MCFTLPVETLHSWCSVLCFSFTYLKINVKDFGIAHCILHFDTRVLQFCFIGLHYCFVGLHRATGTCVISAYASSRYRHVAEWNLGLGSPY